MKEKAVKINNDIYRLVAVPCDISGAISIELISDLTPLIIAFFDNNIELLNKEIRTSVNSEKLMRIFKELIYPEVLLKNGDVVKDWTEEFQCRPLAFFKLGFEALRFNCEDFFTFMSGFAKENNLGENWNEIMQNLKKDGVEIPPMFSQAFQNGEQNKEEIVLD